MWVRIPLLVLNISRRGFMTKLLTRDEFRKQVFQRDNFKCVMCGEPAVDAHHIIERRLWPDYGYYVDNGASVCETHHRACETTEISVEQIREACKIQKAMLPPHLYDDEQYDKWGNIILPNGSRIKGELFFDESVQKILKDRLNLFTDLVKYPRTYHLPWSEGMHNDDRMMESTEIFKGKRVIIVEKLDGENTSMYRDHIHARSVDSNNHESRNWVKQFWSTFRYEIPEGWRICGENMFAKHSIQYDNLETYLYGFSIWNERNECLSWDEMIEWFQLLGITCVPVLYDGIYDEAKIKALYDSKKDWETREGYIIRVADKFSYSEFRKKTGKFVRKGHINTAKHWMYGQQIEKNKLSRE